MSTDMVSIVVIGRLTRDAELKYTPNGNAITAFDVATSARVKQGDQWGEEPSFWSVELWGKLGESLVQYMTKGKQIAVQGSARIEKWEKDGQPRQKVKINAQTVQLLGSKREDSQPPAEKPAGDLGYGTTPPATGPFGRNPAKPAAPAPFEDDDPIPF